MRSYRRQIGGSVAEVVEEVGLGLKLLSELPELRSSDLWSETFGRISEWISATRPGPFNSSCTPALCSDLKENGGNGEITIRMDQVTRVSRLRKERVFHACKGCIIKLEMRRYNKSGHVSNCYYHACGLIQ